MWLFGNFAKNRLQDALEGNEQSASLYLSVDVKDKTAFVTGEVPSDRYSGLVEGIASGINGIDRVDLSGLKVTGGAEDAGLGEADSSASQRLPCRGFRPIPASPTTRSTCCKKGRLSSCTVQSIRRMSSIKPR